MWRSYVLYRASLSIPSMLIYVQSVGFVRRLSNTGGLTREPSAYLVELVGANLSERLKNAAGPNPPKPPVVEFMVVLVDGETGSSELLASGNAHESDAGPYISRASAESIADGIRWGTTAPKVLSAKLETLAAASTQLGSRAAMLTVPNDAMVWVVTLKGVFSTGACSPDAGCVPILYDQVFSVVEDDMTGRVYSAGYNVPLTGHISMAEATAAALKEARGFGTEPTKVLSAKLENVGAANEQAGMSVTSASVDAETMVWLVWAKGPYQPICKLASPCPAIPNTEYFITVNAITAQVMGVERNPNAPGAAKD